MRLKNLTSTLLCITTWRNHAWRWWCDGPRNTEELGNEWVKRASNGFNRQLHASAMGHAKGSSGAGKKQLDKCIVTIYHYTKNRLRSPLLCHGCAMGCATGCAWLGAQCQSWGEAVGQATGCATGCAQEDQKVVHSPVRIHARAMGDSIGNSMVKK